MQTANNVALKPKLELILAGNKFTSIPKSEQLIAGTHSSCTNLTPNNSFYSSDNLEPSIALTRAQTLHTGTICALSAAAAAADEHTVSARQLCGVTSGRRNMSANDRFPLVVLLFLLASALLAEPRLNKGCRTKTLRNNHQRSRKTNFRPPTQRLPRLIVAHPATRWSQTSRFDWACRRKLRHCREVPSKSSSLVRLPIAGP